MAWVQVGSRPGDILSSSLGTGPSPASFGCLVSCLSGPRLSFACLTPCTGISWCCFVDCQHGPSSHPSRPGCRGSRHLSGRRQCSILAHCSPGTLCGDSRDHFLELPQRGLGVGARGHIVLDPVDERRIGYASGVGGGVLAPAGKSSPRQRPALEELFGVSCRGRVAYPGAVAFPLSAMSTACFGSVGEGAVVQPVCGREMSVGQELPQP